MDYKMRKFAIKFALRITSLCPEISDWRVLKEDEVIQEILPYPLVDPRVVIVSFNADPSQVTEIVCELGNLNGISNIRINIGEYDIVCSLAAESNAGLASLIVSHLCEMGGVMLVRVSSNRN